jgi:DNA (cytosine-5)-methyltransferase 1
MDLLTEDKIMDFECAGYSEIDTNALHTYKTIYEPSEGEIDMGDIVAFTKYDDGFKKRIASLGQVTLLSGGFPCQTFSMMGKQAGFEDEDRGQMFFRILDIVDATKPKYLLLENVKNLVTHDNKRTYQRIEMELNDRGYQVFSHVFNSSDFGLPQTRNRILIFATRMSVQRDFRESYNPQAVKELFWKDVKNMSIDVYQTTLELLAKSVPSKYFLSERIKPTLLADGSANFKSKSEINLKVARPLTASMHKMHRACQDNYYSQDWIESNGEVNPYEFCTKEELAKYPIRKLTPQEAYKLQGFPGDFATKAQNVGISDGALYKQAGNAVSVNTIYAVLYYLIKNKAIR